MESICRERLLEDALMWLPDENVLDDSQILSIAELIIARVGDRKDKYPEVLCKLLSALADANLVKGGGSGRVLSEKLGDHSISFANIGGNIWTDFKDSLKNICPIFGYIPSNGAHKAVINVGEYYDPITGRTYVRRR